MWGAVSPLPLSWFAGVSEESGGLEEVNRRLSDIHSLGCSLGSAPVIVNNRQDEQTKSAREHVIIPNIMASPYRIIQSGLERGNCWSVLNWIFQTCALWKSPSSPPTWYPIAYLSQPQFPPHTNPRPAPLVNQLFIFYIEAQKSC